MITGFDNVVIAVNDLDAGAAAYEMLLGQRATHADARDGVRGALIDTNNIAVELIAPGGDGETARRLRATLEEGEGLKSLVFSVSDIDAAYRRCERVGLAPELIKDGDGSRSFRANTERTHGVRLFFLQRSEQRQVSPVQGLDHAVIRTGNAERAAALYGARLGLDMRLDREVMGRRLMFFRCGDAIVEIVHDPALADSHDKLWGLSWRVADADATRARLANAGVDVSDVRTGMKPGTRVFTVRNKTSGVPTLMIENSKRD